MSKSVYEKNQGAEYYSIKDGKQQYCVNVSGHQYYARDVTGNEFYARDENHQQYYAHDVSKNQYYVKSENGQDVPIEHNVAGNKVQIYAVDAHSNGIYPKNASGKEFLIVKNNVNYYAKDEYGIDIYPKSEFGIEYVDKTLGMITLPDGKVKPPIGKDQRPEYKKTINNAEIYYTDDAGDPYFCKNGKGDEIYAKDEYGHEFYPQPVKFARNRHNNFYYAVDVHNQMIYPTNEKGEFYIETPKGSYHILKSSKSYVSYARQGAKQIYPTKKSQYRISEYVINEYATINKNSIECPYYPKDSDYNEYVHNGNFIEEEGYPITSDGFIIIPNIDNKPKFIEDKIIQYTKLLYRPDFKSYDFLSNVLSTRKGVGKNVLYKTLNITSPKISILHYIIAFLILINILLLTRL